MKHATAQINLENIIISEINQAQKTNIHLDEVLRIGKYRDRSRTEVSRGQIWGKAELLFNVHQVFLWDNENVLKMDSGASCTTLKIYLMPQDCTLKKWLKRQLLYFTLVF